MIYSWDPGKVTGMAKGTVEGKLLGMAQYTQTELFDFLNTMNKDVDTFIIEEFRIRPDKAASFIYSDMQTIQIIGALRYKAHQLGAPVFIQSPTLKSLGYKYAGITPPKNHDISHSSDAYSHLSYWWVKELKLLPIVFRRTDAKEI
jgi:hypothetical protein